jgi:hypothetical protein
MNGKATRMLFAAVGLSAFAALLASTANARIPDGDVVKVVTAQSQLQQAAPESAAGVPAEIYAASLSATVVREQQAAPESVPGVPAEIYAASTSPTVVSEQEAAWVAVAGIDPAIYAASTSPTVVTEQQTPQASGTFGVDPEIYATLDPAIKAAIQARSHVSPLATKAVGAGTRRKQVAQAFPYLGNRSQVAGGQARHEKALLPHGIQVGLP